MTKIKLNRKQIDTLIEITAHFKEANEFVIKSENLSGIGPTISVSFNLFPDNELKAETKVDLTDVSTW